MLGSRSDDSVTCIACGATVPRTEAREYDKEGNRWEREDKEFEYLCKPCDRDRDHQPRRGLESLLVDCGAGNVDREAFLSAYVTRVREDSDSVPERDS